MLTLLTQSDGYNKLLSHINTYTHMSKFTFRIMHIIRITIKTINAKKKKQKKTRKNIYAFRLERQDICCCWLLKAAKVIYKLTNDDSCWCCYVWISLLHFFFLTIVSRFIIGRIMPSYQHSVLYTYICMDTYTKHISIKTKLTVDHMCLAGRRHHLVTSHSHHVIYLSS